MSVQQKQHSFGVILKPDIYGTQTATTRNGLVDEVMRKGSENRIEKVAVHERKKKRRRWRRRRRKKKRRRRKKMM